MKKILFILLFTPLFSLANTLPITEVVTTDDAINAVIGDLSFVEKFGRMPGVEDSESLRIRTHLEYVEKQLRKAGQSHLSKEQICARENLLNLLQEYWQAGEFPQNCYYPGRRPVFIDEQENICAVGYLVQQSAGNDLAEQINTRYKYAYLPEMKDAALAKWVADAGLSPRECAMIQPAYIDPVQPRPRPRPNPRPDLSLFSLELRSNQVNTKITGQSATTSMDQVFYNPTQNQIQGHYIFPIPKGASIDQFSMFINGKETPGELLTADKAKKIYEDILRRMKDPALLEYYENALFRVRIFPIQPRTEQRVKLTYTQTLTKENGTIEYIFPFKHQSSEQKAVGQASFKIEVEGNAPLKTIYCPTHEVEIIRKGAKRATIGFEGKNLISANDFKLYYNTDESKVGLSMLPYREGKEDGYFFMNVSPGFATPEHVVEKDITFVLDCSGSMAGEKMEQAKKALKFCVENLNDGDRFNIIRFSTETDMLFETLETAKRAERQSARKYIDKLRAIGGTNIDEALEKALEVPKDPNRPYFVVFMTDGKPTIGETNVSALLQKVGTKNTDNTRIFTFGIGHELNTHLLDKLTQMTQAYRTYVAPDEDIEVKVSDFYTKVSSPVLTDIEVDFGKKVRVTQTYPKKIGDLFMGSTLTLFGRYEGSGMTKVTVKGKVNGKKEAFSYTIDFPKEASEHEFIPPLWGGRAVGYLLDQIRLNGETKELRDEVVRLAKKHGIITPYTSYLIIEDERQLLSSNQIRQEDIIISNRTSTRVKKEQESRFRESLGASGKASVEASEEIQEMNLSDNLAAKDRISDNSYRDDQGNLQNLAANITNVRGRAMYQYGNQWTDANIQLNRDKQLAIKRVQFNSEAYFKLLKEEPDSRDFLALGQNVRFELNQVIYEVFE